MNILLVDFSGKQTLSSLLELCPEIKLKTETSDGAIAYQLAFAWPAEVVVFNLDGRPSHIRQTMQAIAERKAAKNMILLAVSAQQTSRTENLPEAISFVSVERLIAKLCNNDE
ncbi:MAG: hypothetical protein IPM52_11920 [Bacteroidetes bacterium]|nr:hypothetical protein [Bacteroidota bacterium]